MSYLFNIGINGALAPNATNFNNDIGFGFNGFAPQAGAILTRFIGFVNGVIEYVSGALLGALIATIIVGFLMVLLVLIMLYC